MNRWECECGKIVDRATCPKRCRACGKAASGKPVGRPKVVKSEPKLEEATV